MKRLEGVLFDSGSILIQPTQQLSVDYTGLMMFDVIPIWLCSSNFNGYVGLCNMHIMSDPEDDLQAR